MEDNIKTSDDSESFYCKFCDFKCSKKGDWNRHISRQKHINNEKKHFIFIKNPIQKTHDNKYLCNCGKYYQYASGLWRHRKICLEDNNNSENHPLELTSQTQLTPELLIEIIKQNKELQQVLIDQNKGLQQALIDQNKKILDLSEKSGSYNTTNNTTNNNTNCGNNNKTFNLQVFLNETCKDAINMSEFVNQLQVSLTDLETTGRIGYAEGISKVFIKNLNEINYTNRPLHCSDSKRETLYIKENNKWTKDDDQKSGLTKAIKQVANKNIKQIIEWQKKHPEYSNPESRENDKYMQIVLNSMSGSTKEEADKNYEKIAKNVIQEVVIKK
jgi:hypothetical protein